MKVALLIYPDFALLDLAPVQTVLSMAPDAQVYLVWKNKELVPASGGFPVQPTVTFDECPRDLDVLFVPGGGPSALRDRELIHFIADRAQTARYVTSVCTGSLLLGAAGLLDGYHAACHWSSDEFLKTLGAIPSPDRVAEDRNRITSDGVTAGVEFAIVLAARLWGEDAAREIELALEYDPQPVFGTGSPERAGAELTQRVLTKWSGFLQETRQAVSEAAERLQPRAVAVG